MISNSWSIKLSQQPLYSTICNMPEPTIVYQGISNQLIAYSNNENIPLPIRKQVLGLQSLPSNQILMLTRYDLSCWDLINNDEVFTKEFQNAQKLYISENYIYVVCGSDLFCYTHGGQEQYVNHLSNNISALNAFQSTKGQQVIIGTDDMSMMRFKGINMTFDYGKIVGVPTSICWIQNGVMVGTQQGPIAYYQSKKSKWKAKSTHSVAKIINFKKDQISNILIVRKNGSIQLRDWKKGQTISKIKIGQPSINIHLFDFRKQGLTQIVCVCKSSSVKAFNLEQEVKQQKHKIGQQIQDQYKKVDILIKEKVTLQYEIQKLEELINQKQQDNVEGQTPLSANFKISAQLDYKKGLTLVIKCTDGYISGLSFQQPIMPVKSQRTQKMVYTFQNQNKIAGQIDCQALVHSSYSTKSYQVKAFKVSLPKFWHWGLVSQPKTQIKGFVKFDLVQRNARYLKWMQQCFFLNLGQAQIAKLQAQVILKARFFNYYENSQMELIFKNKQGKVQIWCDSIQILGEVIQDLMEYTGSKQLDSQLSFPKQKQKLKEILSNIEKLSQTKISINSQMAEAINNIKFMLVKGQSSIAVGNMADLRKSYGQVMNQNKNILLQIQKKNHNTSNLSDSLKILGKFINQTSNVRFGKAKQTIVTQCRQAIKKKDFPKIISFMEKGASSFI